MVMPGEDIALTKAVVERWERRLLGAARGGGFHWPFAWPPVVRVSFSQPSLEPGLQNQDVGRLARG
jgi:hypothetical protein